MASVMLNGAEKLTLFRGLRQQSAGVCFLGSDFHGKHLPKLNSVYGGKNCIRASKGRNRIPTPKCSLSASRPTSQPRFIQHKDKQKDTLKECKIIEGDAEELPFFTDSVDRYVSAGREQVRRSLPFDENMKRRLLLVFFAGSSISFALPSCGKTKKQNPYDERRLLEQNRRIQRENGVPDDFPNFVREGFTVKVMTLDNYVTRDSGLVFWDIEIGEGDCPKAGQQVTFHYIGYNESGRRIDSTYLQGSPAKVRLGTKALIPGFEEGIQDMRPGGKRRMIVPPELGPPVGPSTFFSSKQFEVFDVELLSIQDCTRRTIGFYSDVVCG